MHSTLVPVGADAAAWEQAVARVEEARGSAGGIATPAELKHGSDNRRFLATQMADAAGRYEIPHDAAELAEMIQAGQLVSLKPLGDDYVLYEVGTDAQEDPLVHYDPETGRDVPLYGSFEDFEREDARLTEAAQAPGATGTRARQQKDWIESFYRDAAQRDRLVRKYQDITRLAGNLDGFSYNLHDPTDRMLLQWKLASYLRPVARDVLLGIARDYHQRFGRPLPVTSLVRTDRYQRRLGRRNPNATEVEFPPHTTGAAFDISYKYMAPDEQNFVMQDIARLKDEGRVEALRERRGHVHVYVFAEGRRPPETLIASFLDNVEAARRLPRGAPNPGPAGGGTPAAPLLSESLFPAERSAAPSSPLTGALFGSRTSLLSGETRLAPESKRGASSTPKARASSRSRAPRSALRSRATKAPALRAASRHSRRPSRTARPAAR
jgi:uncharacterized protein DUF5715